MVEKTTLKDNLAFVSVKNTLDLVNSTMNFKKMKIKAEIKDEQILTIVT